MPIRNEAQWEKWKAGADTDMSKFCSRAALRVMEVIDSQPDSAPIEDIQLLFDEARRSLSLDKCPMDFEWKTDDVFMNNIIATTVIICHSRGEEVRKAITK